MSYSYFGEKNRLIRVSTKRLANQFHDFTSLTGNKSSVNQQISYLLRQNYSNLSSLYRFGCNKESRSYNVVINDLDRSKTRVIGGPIVDRIISRTRDVLVQELTTDEIKELLRNKLREKLGTHLSTGGKQVRGKKYSLFSNRDFIILHYQGPERNGIKYYTKDSRIEGLGSFKDRTNEQLIKELRQMLWDMDYDSI